MDFILNKIEDQHEPDTEMGSRLLELANDLKVKIADKDRLLVEIVKSLSLGFNQRLSGASLSCLIAICENKVD